MFKYMEAGTDNNASSGKSLSAASLIYRPESWVDPLPLSTMFPHRHPLEVELGSGDGSFLATWAEQNRDRDFLGVERLLGRLRKLDRKAARLGLSNLRLMRVEASYFVNYLLLPASVSALHLYFPDPWPKRKHRKNRLVNATFSAAVARVLVPGGAIHLRTDDEDYFQQMRAVFGADPNFVQAETPPMLEAVVTDFERDFNAQGIITRRATYTSITGPPPESGPPGRGGPFPRCTEIRA
jgi:tRNA (guanine-N7-)-methyltransferase